MSAPFQARKLPRRDRCLTIGTRADGLKPTEAATAWYHLSANLIGFAERDIPKFEDILMAVRKATVVAKSRPKGV